MRVITSQKMPKANGHYSQCIEHKGLLYLSGQLPIDPESREIPTGIQAQALLALQNVERVLNAAGKSKNDVLSMRVYISNIDLWDKVDAVYAEFFGDHKPTRSIVPTRELHFGSLIEIEALAVAE